MVRECLQDLGDHEQLGSGSFSAVAQEIRAHESQEEHRADSLQRTARELGSNLLVQNVAQLLDLTGMLVRRVRVLVSNRDAIPKSATRTLAPHPTSMQSH